MNYLDRIYMGTWQFDGNFQKFSESEIKNIIFFALDCGIYKFDTAAAYGKGNVEIILGHILPTDAVIITKIPALKKPDLLTSNSVNEYYSVESIRKSTIESLQRLNRKSVNTILLHNWVPSWNFGSLKIFEALNGLKRSGLTQRVGISLPDGFGTELPVELVRYIDVVESPFNPHECWILGSLSALKKMGKEVLLRSIFAQGLLLKDENERLKLASSDYRRKSFNKFLNVGKQKYQTLFHQALKLGTSVVVGMTDKKQIRQNLKLLKGG